ncbi:MAG: hypothetical protein ACTSWR_01495, partial [Candidatus Helarchaeota archaeon]
DQVYDLISVPDIDNDGYKDIIYLTSSIDHRTVGLNSRTGAVKWNVSELKQGNSLEYNIDNTFFDCAGNLRNTIDGSKISDVGLFVIPHLLFQILKD